jgi:hypothetical protein
MSRNWYRVKLSYIGKSREAIKRSCRYLLSLKDSSKPSGAPKANRKSLIYASLIYVVAYNKGYLNIIYIGIKFSPYFFESQSHFMIK